MQQSIRTQALHHAVTLIYLIPKFCISSNRNIMPLLDAILSLCLNIVPVGIQRECIGWELMAERLTVVIHYIMTDLIPPDSTPPGAQFLPSSKEGSKSTHIPLVDTKFCDTRQRDRAVA
jgi:hypothetical protein